MEDKYTAVVGGIPLLTHMNDFKSVSDIPIGYVTNSMFNRRMIIQNKNVLGVTIGKTGSGKSYMNLSMLSLWYQFRFGEPFPAKNICFSVDEVTALLLSGNLRRGEIIILEEGGVNMGNLDFQNKLSKTFNYILQSFRSMNIGLVVNLPAYSMLNSQTRLLLHVLFETVEIDKTRNECLVKCLLLDGNPRTGKEYTHYPKVLVDGTFEKIQRLSFPLPPKDLREAYEKRKDAFVRSTIEKASSTQKESKNVTELQARSYFLKIIKNLSFHEVGQLMGISHRAASEYYKQAVKLGVNENTMKNYVNLLGDLANLQVKPIPALPST